MQFCVVGPSLPVTLEIVCPSHNDETWRDQVGRKQRKRTVNAESHTAALLDYMRVEFVHPETGRLEWWVCDRESIDRLEVPTGGHPKDWDVSGTVVDWSVDYIDEDWQALDLHILLNPARADQVECCDAAPEITIGSIGINSYRHDQPGGCAALSFCADA